MKISAHEKLPELFLLAGNCLASVWRVNPQRLKSYDADNC